MDYCSVRSWGFSWFACLLALVACAVPQPVASQSLRTAVGAYELEVLVDGVSVRTFEHAGETYLLGQQGARYVLRVHNRSGRRIEAVVTVDGLDVIDGKSGNFATKRGYLVDAYGFVDIDGWRLSNREVAAFRFAPIGESYAAKTGRARNVGVIGVAVFPERIVRQPVYVPEPRYFERSAPSDRRSSYDEAGADYFARDKAAGPAREAPPAPAASQAPMGRSGGAANASKGESSALADGSRASEAESRRSRTGLGTEFGEARYSQVQHVEFVRANSSRPSVVLGARYNDRAGLYALGIDVDGYYEPSDLALRQSADPFPRSNRFARPPADWRRD